MLLIAAVVLPNRVAQQAPLAKAQRATPPKSQQGTATKRAPAAKAQTALILKTQKEKASYAMGMNFGTGLRKQSVDIDPAILARGFRDAFSNGKTLLTEHESRAPLTQL